jgi:hypothetical protein
MPSACQNYPRRMLSMHRSIVQGQVSAYPYFMVRDSRHSGVFAEDAHGLFA